MGARRAAIWAPVILAGLSMLGPFSVDTPFPAFTHLQSDFGVGAASTQQLVSVYLVCFGLMSIFHGPLSDAVGRRPVIVGSLLIYLLASVGCALAPSMEVLLGFRVLQGLSAGGSVIVSRTIIVDLYEGPQAQRLMSRVMLIFGLAPAIAPIIGGWLLQWGSWRLIFWFMAALAAALILATATLPESHPAERRTPLRVGVLLSRLAEVARTPDFWRVAGAAAFAFASFFLYIGAAAIFVVDLLGRGEQDFWVFFVPAIVGMSAGSLISGRAAGRVAPARLVSIALGAGVVAAVLNVALAGLDATDQLPWAVLGPSLLAGVVMVGYPTLNLRVMQMFPHAKGAATSGATFLALTLNAVIAGAVAPLVTESLSLMAWTALVLILMAVALWAWQLAASRRTRHG